MNLSEVHTKLREAGIWHSYEYQGEDGDTLEYLEALDEDSPPANPWWFGASRINAHESYIRYQHHKDGGGYEKLEIDAPEEFLALVVKQIGNECDDLAGGSGTTGCMERRWRRDAF